MQVFLSWGCPSGAHPGPAGKYTINDLLRRQGWHVPLRCTCALLLAPAVAHAAWRPGAQQELYCAPLQTLLLVAPSPHRAVRCA